MDHHAQLVRTVEVQSYVHPESSASVQVTKLDKLGIEDVRTITHNAHLRPATQAGQVFVIATSFVTHEAQNALLKLFEEPPADTVFVLVVPPAFQLLPTLQSRIGQETVLVSGTDGHVWKSFIQASYADRLEQIDTWHKTKDQSWLTAMVSDIHTVQYRELDQAARSALQLVSHKLQTRGASNKMLLEHLALVLPLRK